jgi:hypothetical protein
MKTVSGAWGPLASIPSARAAAMAGPLGFEHAGQRHLLNGLPQRHMNGDQHGFELVIGQHHAHGGRHLARRAAFGLQQLGVPGVGLARQGQRLFVQRRRHDACHGTDLRQAHRLSDTRCRRSPRPYVYLADGRI